MSAISHSKPPLELVVLLMGDLLQVTAPVIPE